MASEHERAHTYSGLILTIVRFTLMQILNGQEQAGQKEIQNIQCKEKRTPGNVILERRFVLKDEKWNKRERSPQGETPPS